jgi:NADPH2:quinone reductase
MRAVLVEAFSAVKAVQIRDIPDPRCGPGKVRVRVAVAGLGFVDGLKIQGLYQTKDPLPFVPGMEISGTVQETGEGVRQFQVGDRVFGLTMRGALAEEVVVAADELALVPARLSFAQAAAVPMNYLTAAFALTERAALRRGETLLVLGAAGGTGTAAIKIARMIGARVIAGASTEEKRALACAEGADASIDYGDAKWREALGVLTNGRPVDVVFDPVGGDISPIAFRTLGWRGRHLVVGFAAGKIPSLQLNIALLKGASLMGVDSAQIRKWEPEVYTKLMGQIGGWLESGSLEPPPVQVFPFVQFQDAFEAMSSRRAMGKVVVAVTPETS